MSAAAEPAPYETLFTRLRARLEEDEADEDVAEAAHVEDVLRRGGIRAWFARVPSVLWTFIGLLGGMGIAYVVPIAANSAPFLDPVVPALAAIGQGVKDAFGVVADLAPVIIFFTLTPALIMMFRTSSAGRFALYVMVAYTLTTALGGLWALLVTFAFFPDLPFGFGASGLGSILAGLAQQTADLAFTTRPFKAIWGAVLAALLLYFGGGLKHAFPRNGFQRMLWGIADIYELIGVHGVAALGKLIKVIMPYALFAIGIFLVTTLPATLDSAQASTAGLADPPFGAVQGYFITVGVLVAITFLWLGIVGFALARYTGFSFRRLLRDYMLVVYPFSWSTSSSAASIPINLESARKGLHVRSQIRDFVIPLGATVNLDGTMMSAVVTTVVACKMVGFTPSLLDLLVALVPLVVITVGTPGVPNGLAFVAGPVLATLLPLPPGTEALFTGIFIAFGTGLNDQFRTAVNTLDNGFLCLLFDKWWPTKFEPGAAPNPLMAVRGPGAAGGEVEPSVLA